MTRPTPAPAPGVSRRAVLRLGATAPLALLVSACSGSVVNGLEAPRSTPPAPSNPDQPALDAVIGAVTALGSALRPLRTQDPAFADLVALHDAHLTRLGRPLAPVPVPAPHLDGSVAQVRTRETALATQLADHAAEVGSGELARLLAAMSAAITQRVATLAAR